MKERIFTTKEQGRALVEAGLPISTASGFRNRYLDRLHSMEDEAGRHRTYRGRYTGRLQPCLGCRDVTEFAPI